MIARRLPGQLRTAAPIVVSLLAAIAVLANPSQFVLGLGVSAGIWIVLGVSYSVTFGLAGQFSVAHAALFGTGAYATAILATRWGVSFWWTLPAAAAAGTLAGAVIGLPAWRLAGDYVALITLAAGVMFQEVALNWTPVTGGAQGIANIPPVAMGDHVFSDVDYFLLSASSALAIVLVATRLRASRLGRTWLAIREDELAAQAVGIRTGMSKVLAFAVGGGAAAVAGSIYAAYQTFVSSVSFGVVQSVQVILIVLLAGPGRMWSAAVAAASLTVATAELATVADVSLALYGALVLVVIMLRGGVFSSSLRVLSRTLAARRDQGAGDRSRSPAVPMAVPTPTAEWTAASSPANGRPVLDVVSVTRDYGGVRAVDAVSLSLRPGQILAVIGQNGSGKTTLVNVITGVHRPTSGRIIFDGREVTGWPLSAIARLGVARTFQNLRLFEALSVRDNVLLGLGGRGRADHLAERTLEQLGVGQFADALVSDLSHGERRRVEIARALVADPALLVLDEPTAGLTSAETEGFLGALERVRTERRAALVIEHNLDAVGRIADEVLVMHQGRQIARGPVAAALGEPAVRRLYLGAEA